MVPSTRPKLFNLNRSPQIVGKFIYEVYKACKSAEHRNLVKEKSGQLEDWNYYGMDRYVRRRTPYLKFRVCDPVETINEDFGVSSMTRIAQKDLILLYWLMSIRTRNRRTFC
ncbi:unnamed protein product [Caenorhabditis auriculariae]|uniref:Uncharacterized protein n=1 Tax=Caenorhabditis auriculariae TaxID=2777116 RepID=A0A8S1GNI7_9PELO|nr:unnamed protein product [Caenorhabditis auriculariae]